MRTDTPLLETKDVCKRFGTFQALSNASIRIDAGRVLGIVGSNGAGKSTLIKVLTGAHVPSTGSLTVKGQPVPTPTPQKMLDLGVSCIYQHSSMAPTLSVTDNLFLGRQPLTRFGLIDRKEQDRRARKLMEEHGFEIDLNAEVGALPPVDQKEAEILKALAGSTDIILMDEPTAWLSNAEVETLHKTVRKLTARGKGIVYISHVLDEVFEICDDIVIMRDGGTVWSGPAPDIDMPHLVDLMVGAELGEASLKAAMAERRPRGTGNVALSCKSLGKTGVFEDITFDLHKGEILVITGLIGSKRSEVVRSLFGAETADKGEIFKDGKPFPKRARPAEAIARGVAFVPEDRHSEGLMLSHDISENLILPSLAKVTRMSILNKSAIKDLTARQIKDLEIKPPNPRAIAGRLSGGNQQKLLLSKWLELKPTVLILDEPTVGVDVGAKSEIYSEIRALRDAGGAVLVVSSDMEEVLTLADRILVMHDGKIVDQADGDKVKRDGLLASVGGDKP